MPTRRVFVSMPADFGLTARQNDVKWAIVKEIEALGYEAQVFSGPAGGWGLAAGTGWSLSELDRVMRRCSGAALIGFPKWRFSTSEAEAPLPTEGEVPLAAEGEVLLPTEYCHYEGAVAYTYGLPILALLEHGVVSRVIFNFTAGLEIITIPPDAAIDWLQAEQFRRPLATFKKKLDRRRDVFLGYASSSRGLAVNIKRLLKEIGATTLDWQEDFAPGRSILDQISEASSRCSSGIFLFTKDDKLDTQAESAAPRDNVVLEAGFFMSAKGKDRVLIVREVGSKMPADLGGDIYASLPDKSDITPIEGYLKAFIENL